MTCGVQVPASPLPSITSCPLSESPVTAVSGLGEHLHLAGAASGDAGEARVDPEDRQRATDGREVRTRGPPAQQRHHRRRSGPIARGASATVGERHLGHVNPGVAQEFRFDGEAGDRGPDRHGRPLERLDQGRTGKGGGVSDRQRLKLATDVARDRAAHRDASIARGADAPPRGEGRCARGRGCHHLAVERVARRLRPPEDPRRPARLGRRDLYVDQVVVDHDRIKLGVFARQHGVLGSNSRSPMTTLPLTRGIPDRRTCRAFPSSSLAWRPPRAYTAW